VDEFDDCARLIRLRINLRRNTVNHDKEDTDIERWLNEGGMQMPLAVAGLAPGLLDEREGRAIVCLGIGILSIWDEVPSEIRKKVLQMAVTSANYDIALLKQRTERFWRGRKGHRNAPDAGK
jgi:hypothetical protein